MTNGAPALCLALGPLRGGPPDCVIGSGVEASAGQQSAVPVPQPGAVGFTATWEGRGTRDPFTMVWLSLR